MDGGAGGGAGVAGVADDDSIEAGIGHLDGVQRVGGAGGTGDVGAVEAPLIGERRVVGAGADVRNVGRHRESPGGADGDRGAAAAA